MIISPGTPGRRSVLRSAVTGLGAAMITGATSGCTPGDQGGTTPGQDSAGTAPAQGTAAPRHGRRVLLAYFSRAGENYYYGGRTDLDMGNTQVLAGMISTLINCDVYRVEAAEPYPAGYDATVARNVREQEADARPLLASPLPSVDQYDTLLLASGIWNVRAPMIMATFAESYDFTGKTIFPVTTHAMSGLGTTERDYARSCPGGLSARDWPCGARKSGRPARTSNPGLAARGFSRASRPGRRRHAELRKATLSRLAIYVAGVSLAP